MRSPQQVFVFIVAFIFLSVTASRTLRASDTQLIVNNAPDAACSTSATPACYRTIQAAIDYANTIVTANSGKTLTYSILVEPGTYSEAITLKTGVSTVHGRETATTILNSSGTAPAVTISNISTALSFRNFSFMNTSAGIVVSGSPSVISITNNIFYGTSGTAVTIQGSASAKIINNTFYLNGTAVYRDLENNQITNNIFSNNTVNISQSAAILAPQNNITYNDFNPIPGTGEIIGSSSIPDLTFANPDPLFADISDVSRLDVHLRSGSPCINSGDPNQGAPKDIGAYGGTNTDTIPRQVSNVNATTSSASISLTWNANVSYAITGYRIYYGNAPGVYTGTDAAEGASPINVSTVTTATLSNLSKAVAAPANPHLNKPTALNEGLILSWNAIPGATRYRVYYGPSFPPNTPVDVDNTTTYTLPGLTNGQTYFVAVSAIAEPNYYIAVTAFDSIGQTKTADIVPGINHESAYSQEVPVSFGSAMESGLSNIESDYPEALVAYPNLQNSRLGCFIATAAYGHYSAPEVQALREFRDHYLLTNRAGSAFVRWYYEYGPVAAAYLDAHPGYKPMVRTALMPAIGLALFMTGTSLFIKAVAALFIVIIALMTAFHFSRKRLTGSGGA